MKLSLLVLLFLFPIAQLSAQTFTSVVCAKDDPSNPVTNLSADDLEDDAYTVTIYLSAEETVIEEIGLYNIEVEISLNGKSVKNNAWARFEKAEEITDHSAIKISFEVGDIAAENAHHVTEKGNVVSFNFLNENKDNAPLGSAEVKFDVPGYNDSQSIFCGELFQLKGKDDKVIATLHTIFKAVYPHTEIIATIMRDEWSVDDTYGGSNTYQVVFLNKGQHWVLKYSASYVIEDGKLLPQPRVKIYNGLDDPIPVSQSCINDLMSKLK